MVIGRALSTHIEVVAPVDTDIVSARIAGEQYDTAREGYADFARDADKLSRSRAQFHVPLCAGEEIVTVSAEANQARHERQLKGRTDRARVSVSLLPRPSMVLAPVSMCSPLDGAQRNLRVCLDNCLGARYRRPAPFGPYGFVVADRYACRYEEFGSRIHRPPNGTHHRDRRKPDFRDAASRVGQAACRRCRSTEVESAGLFGDPGAFKGLGRLVSDIGGVGSARWPSDLRGSRLNVTDPPSRRVGVRRSA